MDFCGFLTPTALEEVLIPNSAYFLDMDLAVAESPLSSSPSAESPSPFLKPSTALWDVEEKPSVASTQGMDPVVAKDSRSFSAEYSSPLLNSATALWDVWDIEDTIRVPSPSYFMDLIVAKDSPSSSSAEGLSPVLNPATALWDVEDEFPVKVINPGLISSLPMKKICRGRRVPTVEMVQKKVVKPIEEYTERKPGRDTFAERRFVCGYVECRKCFKRREHLIRHQRSAHSTEKPFRCPINGCFVSCNRKDNMRQHMRNAHYK